MPAIHWGFVGVESATCACCALKVVLAYAFVHVPVPRRAQFRQVGR